MFQTFSGNSRRPRQVNLSGRNPNPFAKFGGPQGPSETVASAQQSRLERQQERARIQAATDVQRTWRGFRTRQQVKQEQSQEWEDAEANSGDASVNLDARPYSTAHDAHLQLTRLLRFIDVKDREDQQKLVRSCQRLAKGIAQAHNEYIGGTWPSAYLRLQNIGLAGLQKAGEPNTVDLYFDVVRFTTEAIPALTSKNAPNYYGAIRRAYDLTEIPADIVAAPLQSLDPSVELAYQSFASQFLTLPDLEHNIKPSPGESSGLDSLSERINCKLLAGSLRDWIATAPSVTAILPKAGSSIQRRSLESMSHDCAWLTAYLIYFHRQSFGFVSPERYISQPSLIAVLCSLLAVVADSITADTSMRVSEGDARSLLSRKGFSMFVLEQYDVLVDQKSVGSLIPQMNVNASGDTDNQDAWLAQSDVSRSLANYILTLLRLFPEKGDDIRMWLYLGSPSPAANSDFADGRLAIRFFWQACRNTSIFHMIHNDSRKALDLLRPRTSATPAQLSRERRNRTDLQDSRDEWQIILLFIEMYSFVLKVMDDEEFFTYTDDELTSNSTYGRRNSLRRDEIMVLSTFLKHLGFTIYYNAADIIGSKEEESNKTIAELFHGSNNQEARSDSLDNSSQISAVTGVDFDYVQGAVTGLLRAIYQRDSRRPFTPPGHWLMTARFDMTNFINAVVEEEERRHQVSEAEEEEDDEIGEAHWDIRRPASQVGHNHARQLQKASDKERQLRRESRKRYLQAVAPRLEILQNMPFMIPFMTRVQIFRRFVHFDQLTRRNGTTDPEMWRLSQMHQFQGNRLERHHAKVRRGHEFEDAFAQFYDLGASLKEPLHITFLDQFEQEEAGIDGGGVTKEFLTSITNQAFGEQEGVRLFNENEKHLLFPNPSAVDEQRELLLEAGYKENTATFRSHISDMLQRYEFLGRIIGKCLYEGILVDIGFAGFFMLKWALTGGVGSAPKESGYRANVNDLRHFDEELYQGLMKLKYYPGDVETFSLNFTVADTLSVPSGPRGSRRKVVTRDLRPGGTDIPVTNANRLLYIDSIARHRLTQQPYRQTNAFLKGLGAMISPLWLSMFNQQELQTLVGGAASAINVADLRAHTAYGGVYVIGDDGQEHPSVQLFWSVMQSLPDEDRRKVLKFVTSTPRAPLLGFGSLNPRFSVRDSGGDDTRLPSTSTCVNLLKLPRYKDFQTCRTKLLQAVNAGAGFDLS